MKKLGNTGFFYLKAIIDIRLFVLSLEQIAFFMLKVLIRFGISTKQITF